MNVIEIRKHFPIYEHQPHLTYLDSAASALKLNEVLEAIKHYYETSSANIMRSGFKNAYQSTLDYEHSRHVIKQLIHATYDEEVIFTKGATQSINMVAHHYESVLQKGDEILISHLEHHANILPWQNVCKKTGASLKYVALDQHFKITEDALLKSINERTKIVALTYISNVMGYITPLQKVIQKAHEVGAVVLVDAAQAVAHIEINVQTLDCDYLVFSGHKMFGPTGVGILYGKQTLLSHLTPFELGGQMMDEVDEQHYTLAKLPARLEAGTPPIAEAIALAPAAMFIKSIGYNNIHAHIKSIHTYTLQSLKTLKDIEIYNETADIGIVTFNIRGVHAHDVQSFLSEEDVAVRTGHHCAKLIHQQLKQAATIRVSISIYNSKEDIDQLIKALKQAITFFIH
jgi:cysteine desulfurase / selenocysteine lyase